MLAFESLCAHLGCRFSAIDRARSCAEAELANLRQLVAPSAENGTPASSPDTSIVVSGSLARREWTDGSDVDWTLLIDSPGDLLHQQATQEIRRRLEAGGYLKPGPAGVFDGMSFSHDLLHWIGGERDTNTNMTRRLLLLFESTSVSRPEVHTRVVRGILHRYTNAERSFLADTGRKYKVPRFLLNDIVRYWRTMAVDYASKRWERGDEGWALRNIKLRFSRKLLFVAGMLVCFSCFLDDSQAGDPGLFKDEEEAKQRVHKHIAEKLGVAPLDTLCDALKSYARKETAAQVLGAYDAFLQAMNSGERAHLKQLAAEDSYSDPVFSALRTHSHRFQEGLTALFYREHAVIAELTTKYGVF